MTFYFIKALPAVPVSPGPSQNHPDAFYVPVHNNEFALEFGVGPPR